MINARKGNSAVQHKLLQAAGTIALMHIMGKSAHRTLTYIEAMQRQGCPLTRAQVAAYALGSDPIETITGHSAWELSLDFLSRDTVTEDMLTYLIRLGWVQESDAMITPTTLGIAVLREAHAPLVDSDAGSTMEVIIDPKKPFAYAQLMARISTLKTCLIVDPYLDKDELITLGRFTNVTRILTGDKDLKDKRHIFGVILNEAPHLQVRTVSQGVLHDRFAIPAHGEAYMLGSSLNSIAKRFGVVTTLEASSSKAILDNYEAIWRGGREVARSKSQPDRSRGGSTARQAGRVGHGSPREPESTGSAQERREAAHAAAKPSPPGIPRIGGNSVLQEALRA